MRHGYDDEIEATSSYKQLITTPGTGPSHKQDNSFDTSKPILCQGLNFPYYIYVPNRPHSFSENG